MLQGMPYTDLTQAVEINPVSIAPRGRKVPLLPGNWHELCNGGGSDSPCHSAVVGYMVERIATPSSTAAAAWFAPAYSSGKTLLNPRS